MCWIKIKKLEDKKNLCRNGIFFWSLVIPFILTAFVCADDTPHRINLKIDTTGIRSAVVPLKEPPVRPIGETVIGAVLTGIGLTCLPISSYLFATGKRYFDAYDPDDDMDLDATIGWLYWTYGSILAVPGVGCSLSGPIVLIDAKKKWRLFNTYHLNTRAVGAGLSIGF